MICKNSDYWLTPHAYYPKNCFDPCPENPTFDGLKIKWHGKVFCNPPYSQIELWIKKALIEQKNCDSITMLLPNWTDRKWFRLIEKKEIQFLQGRLRFIDPITKTSPYTPRFGSMIVKIKRSRSATIRKNKKN